ncbi:DNA-binding protein [Secundilactobacillus oryzae JCM 18671]|uniref:DNA-binding protein n=1 Tax=Secundilactobacillus oryzae JCM 18671 TaxID=1291743 RepID=A0A081BGF2_9LACO|nr:helix-turn-helix transcriptional regulator [Secundilactobacillus oryzae]GAK47120.1 DNA-binding protein [Secundilactobacillus oryzae JCM 18671]
MNIEKFIETRKKLGYTQTTLASGICTQATISKFEKNGKMISTTILVKLCNRLGLSLNDIFPDMESENRDYSKLLDQAEFDLITSDYEDAFKQLDQIEFDQLNSADRKMQFLYVRGFSLALSGDLEKEAIFCFEQILNGLDESHETIYSQLAYVGLGLTYAQAGDAERAEFFFAKMPERLSQITKSDTSTIWKRMSMLFYTGEFYASVGDYETSDSLLQEVISRSSERHVTFYTARAQFQLAKNWFDEGEDLAKAKAMLRDADAFARFNHNDKLLAAIRQLSVQNKS